MDVDRSRPGDQDEDLGETDPDYLDGMCWSLKLYDCSLGSKSDDYIQDKSREFQLSFIEMLEKT